MGEIVSFKRPKPTEKGKGNTLCVRGFHKWTVVQQNPFDVQRGRLVTRYRCVRCGAEKVEAR